MAGGHVKFRSLDRPSAHRQQLLRNLVTSLFKSESISTTFARAKETQRLAEKLVTLAKRNTSASRRRAEEILYSSGETIPRLFSTIRERYTSRPGGYTRVLKVEPLKTDQAPSAILELVDGPKDMRFELTAQTVARDRLLGRRHSAITLKNCEKVKQFRANGDEDFEEAVQKFIAFENSGREAPMPQKKKLRQIPEMPPDEAYQRTKHQRTERFNQEMLGKAERLGE